jgi:hypothetical protein
MHDVVAGWAARMSKDRLIYRSGASFGTMISGRSSKGSLNALGCGRERRKTGRLRL